MLAQLEGWLTAPFKNDIPVGVLFVFGVVFVVVCVWATDGISLLGNMARAQKGLT